jgi:hypothetical protein
MPRLKFIPSEAEEYLSLLAETTQRIQACTNNVDGDLLSSPGAKGNWLVADVLGHIRGCAEVWSGSIYAMLAQENPVLPAIHPRRWAKVRRYTELAFSMSFTAFALQRQELLQVLRALSEEEWSRGADIGGHRHNIFSQVRRMALHEVEHCQQIEHTLECGGEVDG